MNDQEIERRLTRIERRVGVLIVVVSFALFWIIIQPFVDEFAKTSGITEGVANLMAAGFVGFLGSIFSIAVLKITDGLG